MHVRAQPSAASADYTVQFQEIDFGGRLSESADYQMDLSIVGIEGVARSSLDLTVHHGHAGQLNEPPVVAPLGNPNVNEGSPLLLNARAAHLPPNTFRFSLGGLVPSGMSIDPDTGLISWTPTESQGPSTSAVDIQFTEIATQLLTVPQTLVISVHELNVGPVLPGIAERSVDEGILLNFIVSATDSDIPANVLSYALGPGAPDGASISNAGVFNWTPTEEQGPGVYSITIEANDNGSPPLTASQSFSVTVGEVNQAPRLAPFANQTVDEGKTLSLRAIGSDPDLPTQTLHYSLSPDAPSGASIDPASGAFSWTPSEAHGPGNYTVTVTVTDDGSPALSASQIFSVTVNEVNVAPFLAAIENQIIREGETMTAFVAGADLDLPPQRLIYSLRSAPAGVTIDPVSGSVRWTPSESQGGTTNSITVALTDDSPEAASVTQTFQVVVLEVNSPPVIDPISARSIKAGSPLSVIVTASDPDIPADILSFSLPNGGPRGASIDPASGEFHWTPDPLTPEGTVTVTVQVSDNGSPLLSATASFDIRVTAGNSPPAFPAIDNQAIDEESMLTLNVSATDPDGDALSYSLDPGAPEGVSIDSSSGVFAWTPAEDQGPGSFAITVRVTDNGTPPLSATRSFEVTVNEVNAIPEISEIADQRAEAGVALTVAAAATDVDRPPNRLRYALEPGAPPGAVIDSESGVFSWTPAIAQSGSTNRIGIRVTDDGIPNRSAVAGFVVVVPSSNHAPVVSPVSDQSVDEQSALAVAIHAEDPDQPLSYELIGGPAGAAIHRATGLFSWTPNESQGPSTNTVTVRVTDSGTPPLSATQRFSILVREVNRPPTLSPISDQALGLGDTLRLQASATDPDVPANTLTFSLAAGAPAGAAIDPAGGLLTWTPNQGGVTNEITVVVRDNGTPPLSDSKTFSAFVSAEPNVPPAISSIADQTTPENIPTALIAFSLTDPDTPIENLSLSGQSGNTVLVPNGNIIFGGGGTNRTVRITPARGQIGAAPITIEAGEPAGGRATVSFSLTVTPAPPGIVRQPSDQTVFGGSPLTLNVLGIGSEPLNYQWSFNGAVIPGATNSLLTIPGAEPRHAGLYSVVLSNALGTVSSRPARVTVNALLRITEQPVGQSVLAGGEARFEVRAGGAPPLAYQWRANGIDVPGATNALLSLTNVEPILAGNYSVAVSDLSGTVVSQSAVLEVLAPPLITRQPDGLTVLEGEDAAFNIGAEGTVPLTFLWLFNGVSLAGATNSTLNVSNVGAADAGSYSVVVSNAGGSVASEEAPLVVGLPPVITRRPLGKAALAGSTVNLSVSVSATPPVRYQWQHNGAEIPGSTATSLSIQNLSTDSAGEYTVVAATAAGAVTSLPALIEVIHPVTIAVQPAAQSVAEGSSVSFSVSPIGTAPLHFQWRKDGVNIAGATNSTFRLARARTTDAGNYQVVVRNAGGPVASAPAKLTVNLGARILAQPKSLTLSAGSHALFSVRATGTAPLDYQWFFNGAAITGASEPSIIVPNVQPSNAGAYSVAVQNAPGSVTSAEAVLTVLTPPLIETHPVGVTADLGGSVRFDVAVIGDGPLTYQWRRNGVNLAGASSPVLVLNNLRVADAGSYSVVVQNAAGAVTSQSANMTLNVPPLVTGTSAETAPPPIEQAEGTFDGGDLFDGGTQIARRSTAPATETGRWFAWRAPQTGIASFSTAGSTFDTVLSIYTGIAPNLTEIGSDDDTGGFLSSRVRFNAVEGSTYLINVRGFGGDTGRIMVSFRLEQTNEKLPELLSSPLNRRASIGEDVIFEAQAVGSQLNFQWLANGVEIPGATGARLLLSNVRESDARSYTVRVSSGTRTAESPPAYLHVGTIEEPARDKFGNVAEIVGSELQLQSPPSRRSDSTQAGGLSGSLVFSTYGSSKETGEPNHCGETGGASYWFRYVAGRSGVVRFSTEGSSFDTVLAVYSGANLSSLTLAGCDNNSGADGMAGVVGVPVIAGGTYYVAVDGVGGETGLARLSFQAAQEPVITRQPQSQSAVAGTSAALFVLSDGGAVSSYQWYKEGIPVEGETSTSMQFLSVQPEDTGSYEVEIANFAGSVRSAAAELTVTVPVSFDLPPVDQAIAPGSSARFSVIASGSEPIRYQWSLNGVPIAGATEPVYEIANAGVLDAGEYVVMAENAAGATASPAAVLTLSQAPLINAQPQNAEVELGGEALFRVVASGTGELAYQWRRNGLDIASATESSLIFKNVSPRDAGDYTVVVSNEAGSIESAVARLSVRAPLSLIEQPRSQTVTAGSSAVFTVRPARAGDFVYQWRKDGQEIDGAISPVHVVANARESDAGEYTAVVSRGNESIESRPARLNVSVPPVVTAHPQSLVVFAGTDATLEVTALGSGPLTYQWLHDGLPIDGATETALVLVGIGAGSEGAYSVVVSNAAGSVESRLAVLTLERIVRDVRLDAAMFALTVNVPEGRRARVQMTSNLVEWTDLTPEPLTETTHVADPDSLDLPFRFYRVVIE